MSHSPAPWKEKGGSIFDATGEIVADVYRLQDVPAILALPELLAACKIALMSLRAWNTVGVPLDERTVLTEMYENSPEITALTNAIAKAEKLP